MNPFFKTLAQTLLGEYEVYRVFSTERLPSGRREIDLQPQFVSLGADALSACPDPAIASQAWYSGEGSRTFALLLRGQIVALCFYWFGERYRDRNFWPLAPGQAKLVQVFCVPSLRGNGLGRLLIERSTERMLASGFQRLFARVWYTHAESIRAFRSAGWSQVACVLCINPLRLGRPIRLVFPRPFYWRRAALVRGSPSLLPSLKDARVRHRGAPSAACNWVSAVGKRLLRRGLGRDVE